MTLQRGISLWEDVWLRLEHLRDGLDSGELCLARMSVCRPHLGGEIKKGRHKALPSGRWPIGALNRGIFSSLVHLPGEAGPEGL